MEKEIEVDFFADLLDRNTASRHIEQGSDEWDQVRCGRYTSSEWHFLMECGKRPMNKAELDARPKTGKGSKTTLVPDPSKMSATGIKYIRKKVWETLTGQPMQQAYAYPMVRGKEMEPEAVEAAEKRFGFETYTVGFQVFGDHAGGSPDRLIGDKEGLEIKCPSSDEQIDYLMLTDHWDLKREYPKIYWQCATLLLFTNRDKWHLCTYDPRMVIEAQRLTHIEIERAKIEEDLDAILTVLPVAIEEKLKLIKTLTPHDNNN